MLNSYVKLVASNLCLSFLVTWPCSSPEQNVSLKPFVYNNNNTRALPRMLQPLLPYSNHTATAASVPAQTPILPQARLLLSAAATAATAVDHGYYYPYTNLCLSLPPTLSSLPVRLPPTLNLMSQKSGCHLTIFLLIYSRLNWISRHWSSKTTYNLKNRIMLLFIHLMMPLYHLFTQYVVSESSSTVI